MIQVEMYHSVILSRALAPLVGANRMTLSGKHVQSLLSLTASFHKATLVKQQFYVKEFYIINIIFGVSLCTIISGKCRMIVARKNA